MRLAHEQAGVALADAEAAKAQARADVEVARMQVRVSWSGSIEAAHLVHFGSSGFCLHSPAARCPVVISVISAQARAEALKEAQEAAALRKPLRLRSTLGRTLSDATAAATISTTSAVAQEHQLDVHLARLLRNLVHGGATDWSGQHPEKKTNYDGLERW